MAYGNNKNNKNSRNPDSFLFKSLTKLLSGPIVKHRKQNPRQLKRWQLDKYQFKSVSGQNFKKSTYNPFDYLYAMGNANAARAERYVDYDQMEFTAEINSALDIYADEMTTCSPLQKLLTINCSNEEIKDILTDLFYNTLNVEFNLFGWCRSMCKYGDHFLYLDLDEKIGVKSVIGLPSQEIERLEGEDKTNPNYTQFQWNGGGLTFENWQCAHFRILGNDKTAPYGTSVLEGARRVWRQLQLLEDAMMAYRIVRSPERRVFYIDVGGIPEKEIEQHMQRIVTQMKRNQVIDSDTGRVDLRYNPLSVDEDFFIPVRGAAGGTRIESLPGGSYTGDVDDVKYLRDKLFSALKVPAAYLTQGDEGGGEDKTTLAQKDIRFARTISRLQRSIISELEKISIVHLHTLGYRNKDLLSFKLNLNNPSKISELQELEHWRTKFDIAAAATEGYFSRRWVAKTIFNLSDGEIIRNQREMYYDKQFDSALEVASETDAGGGEEFAEEEETFAEPEGEEVAEEDEEGALLATPGKRNDRRGMGARKRSYKGQYSEESGKNTARNLFKGYVDGLHSLEKGIVEEIETNYKLDSKNEEIEFLENRNEIQKLVESLEKVKNKDKQNGEI